MHRLAAVRVGVAPALLVLVLVLCGHGVSLAAGPVMEPPLVGVDYTHYRYPSCDLNDGGIVVRYDRPGVRRTVQWQLAAMRATGVQTLRLLLWHITDAIGLRWGIVSSDDGHLAEPYRLNLIHFLADVRSAGFLDLTLAFAPEGNDAPIPPAPGNVWDPTRFAVNWRFIKDVRPLLKRYGPASTRVDLINEEAPPAWQSAAVITQAKSYIAQMWSNYVTTFGTKDASFSSVGADGPSDTAARMQNLIDALRASGKPIPGWFDVHPPYDHDGMLAVLHAVDNTLTANGLAQPLIIGETAYDDQSVASAIKEFEQTSTRRVLEVMEWPKRSGQSCPPSPPFEASAYLQTLTGTASRMRLTATVPARHGVVLRTAYGNPVTALESGRYSLVVNDTSSRDNFRLAGKSINDHTNIRFTGQTTWKIDLRAGTYRYSSDRPNTKLHGTFIVLAPG
jgi:hypothetical protein